MPAMKDSTAELWTARGPGPSTQVGSGWPATDMVPMRMELVARVRPSVTSAAGAGTVGGVADEGKLPTAELALLGMAWISLAVTR